MPLVLEIEFLLGVSFAAIGPDSAAADWPPQPDWVFSALVAIWAARGQRAEERTALEWLEAQEPPLVHASGAYQRPTPIVFVPPNDPETRSAGDVGVLPAFRRRQPRRFPAALPEDPIVRLVWPAAQDAATVDALDAIARDVSYVGHSSSVTRCHFREIAAVTDHAVLARRRIYPGRLRELEAAFQAWRRPSPGETVTGSAVESAPPVGPFSADWLTFEIVRDTRDGTRDLDIRAAAIAAKALRDTVMGGYGKAGVAVPEWVSGHQPDGTPSLSPHLAVVPLSFAGPEHADGHLMGFALVPPRDRAGLLDDDAFRGALLRSMTEHKDGWRLRLLLGRQGVIDLAVVLENERASLDPQRYARPSRRWATVTPMVGDRHVDALRAEERGAGERRQRELEGMVESACHHFGLPAPDRVLVDRHSAVRGAASAYRPDQQELGSRPTWTAWRIPERLRSRPLFHAVVEFASPVSGPVLLGAGRFCGQGLCLPTDAEPR